MADISTIRHASIFNAIKHREQIHIVGAGAIGSRLWLALVELGITEIAIYDFDVVEPHNLANQIFLASHVGMPKVEALADYYRLKTGNRPPSSMEFGNKKITHEEGAAFDGVVFMALDTMHGRVMLGDLCDRGQHLIRRVFDTRMASSYGDVLSYDPNNRGEYNAWKATLIDDADAEVSPCGGSISVGPTASLITNLAVWQYILSCTDPVGVKSNINAHFKPLVMSIGAL